MSNPVLERLRRYGLRPRRELGQHFLIDLNVIERLAALIAPAPGVAVIEFGSGLGVLTERLLQAGARVVGIELDANLARVLSAELGATENFTLVHADLARVDPDALRQDLGASRVTLAGNLPYQLTSTVLFALLELEERLQAAVLMVQREVAERIVASHGSRDYGILSVLMQA
jgi:16S rRNA (adenine1518-N6/adenine1519-N6)-dimethyltransferase